MVCVKYVAHVHLVCKPRLFKPTNKGIARAGWRWQVVRRERRVIRLVLLRNRIATSGVIRKFICVGRPLRLNRVRTWN